jgi:hypothetical protein
MRPQAQVFLREKLWEQTLQGTIVADSKTGKGIPAQAGGDLEKPGNFQAHHAGNIAGEVLHLVGKFFIDAP